MPARAEKVALDSPKVAFGDHGLLPITPLAQSPRPAPDSKATFGDLSAPKVTFGASSGIPAAE
ncbi:hypothetical protein HUW46_04648 [Amycolatopsis sp. CA-230715]|nr:hypothetical protein HUW46_04648 [Amycolatopsis sp. CA-230715]